MPVLDPEVMAAVVPAIYAAPLVTAALWDARHYRIPNLLPLVLLGAFLPVALLAPQPVDWLAHLGAGAAVFAGGAVLFALRWMGGGDVKLAAAVALWAGPLALHFLAAMAVIGGLLALALLVLRKMVAGVVAMAADRPQEVTLPRLLLQGEGVPYGLAIAGAGLVLATRLPLVAG